MGLLLILWLVGSILVGFYAKGKGKSFKAGFWLSVFVDPILAWILLAIFA
ncbi:hypothetical protein [Budvicia aquatica]|uniref:Uncharacterized protein n=1 Tax=Budvicia aquatica TaxID=82979 RepID=A0A2C6DHI9_9GAMM|nr:hypothetical protein [Budvicia aquatica]PHI28281.1 hypothetical protein CRN84_02485 [Budvicia aquatica]VFS46169.1 Uncharacterised protein [Budvicia aquatica]